MKTFPLALLILMSATALVLVIGLILMVIGGKVNKKYANKLMVARVILQGLALAMVVVMFLMAS